MILMEVHILIFSLCSVFMADDKILFTLTNPSDIQVIVIVIPKPQPASLPFGVSHQLLTERPHRLAHSGLFAPLAA